MDYGDNLALGRFGEDFAASYLTSKHYQILKRNFRAKRYGEVDIIARSPDQKSLIFVEVKTRIGDEYGAPKEAVTFGKMRELKKMVDYYYLSNPKEIASPQIDVVTVTVESAGSLPILEHLENVTL